MDVRAAFWKREMGWTEEFADGLKGLGAWTKKTERGSHVYVTVTPRARDGRVNFPALHP